MSYKYLFCRVHTAGVGLGAAGVPDDIAEDGVTDGVAASGVVPHDITVDGVAVATSVAEFASGVSVALEDSVFVLLFSIFCNLETRLLSSFKM